MTQNSYQWPEFTIADPSASGALTVFPITGGQNGGGDYLLLSVALERGMASVKEKSHGGSVPVIRVHNKSKLPLLGIQGEEYSGSKQNRTFNLSFLVGPGKTDIPVTCVEQGRWRYSSDEFTTGHYETLALRSMKSAMLARSIRIGGASKFHADQGAVWEEVHRESAGHGVSSPTCALSAVYESDKIGSSINETIDGIRLPENTRGVAVAIGGRMVGADIFEAVSVFERMWPRLSRSYALSTLGRKADTPPSLEAAETFLREPIDSQWTATKSVGLGEDIRWEGKGFVATSLQWEGRLLHGSLFAL